MTTNQKACTFIAAFFFACAVACFVLSLWEGVTMVDGLLALGSSCGFVCMGLVWLDKGAKE